MITLSIVVPVYNEAENLPEFLQRLVPALESVTRDFEVIFALDPSTDLTEPIIMSFRRGDVRIKLLKFSRRIGQPLATIGGLTYATGAAMVVMDADLQDPPELIPGMVDLWRSGSDVVLARRRNRRGETWPKRLVSWVGYRLINRIAEVNIPPNTGDFRLMSRRVVDEVLRLNECHGFLRGMVALVGFKQTSILFDRPARRNGCGHYNRWLGSLRIGMNGVIGFSHYLLTLSSKLGLLTAGAAFLLGAAYAAMKVLGVPFPLGNPTIVILILFVGGAQLICAGIMGEYVGRIYDEVKRRPRFIVDRKEGF